MISKILKKKFLLHGVFTIGSLFVKFTFFIFLFDGAIIMSVLDYIYVSLDRNTKVIGKNGQKFNELSPCHSRDLHQSTTRKKAETRKKSCLKKLYTTKILSLYC